MTPKDPNPAKEDAETTAWFASATREVADLLLNGGLYQRVELKPPRPIADHEMFRVLPRRIHMDCTTCAEAGQTTWAFQVTPRSSRLDMHGYKCMSCDSNWVTFMLSVAAVESKLVATKMLDGAVVRKEYSVSSYTIEKVGQYPPWEIQIPPLLGRAFGKEGRSLFIKGASSLRAGRGIGAVAYFRRIIEDHIDRIIDMVYESAVAAGDAAAVEQLANAKKNLFATDRLKIAAQHTPSHLKPGNHNPLDVMYGAFSEGLHKLSDKESAAVAKNLSESIVYFFEMWQQNKERAAQYAQVITKTATDSS
ncbi:hypothetical protein [Cystobacter fuscus]|uniref:hypothetical protein n=1 Tax=Cystobacter fuscus TaxID=43 RepID=UPI0012DD1678|nr:hypothetical protein [Cystobacter fuscus]